MSCMSFRQVRKVGSRTVLLATTVVVGLYSATPFSAADDVLSAAQCEMAKSATLRILEEYKDRMSSLLAQSLERFSATCDLKTDFKLMPGEDDKAWDTFQFRIRVIKYSGPPRR